MSNVGFSRMAGPSGASLPPSTSKNSRTPLTSTCMAKLPYDKSRCELTIDPLAKPLDCFAGDTRPYGRKPAPDLGRQSHFWRTRSLNVFSFRCHAYFVVRPKCHPDFIKLHTPRQS